MRTSLVVVPTNGPFTSDPLDDEDDDDIGSGVET